MALDFYTIDNNEFLFGIDEYKFNLLSDIFENYNHWTGLTFDQYSSFNLPIENLKILIHVIDNYVESKNLNINKQKTVAILEFKGIISYFILQAIDIKVVGD